MPLFQLFQGPFASGLGESAWKGYPKPSTLNPKSWFLAEGVLALELLAQLSARLEVPDGQAGRPLVCQGLWGVMGFVGFIGFGFVVAEREYSFQRV